MSEQFSNKTEMKTMKNKIACICYKMFPMSCTYLVSQKSRESLKIQIQEHFKAPISQSTAMQPRAASNMNFRNF